MIDVIIPVYEGFDETRKCVESVLTKKNNSVFQIIIINDKTPNSEIEEFLEQIKENQNINIIKNKKNLGFVKSVNLGMQYSQNDVILLNSDTIVTDFWIDKLYSAAYSQKRIGTVTALTNNGTISSVPNFNQDNKVPNGYTIESFATLIETCSLKKYPIIPTAVGHCMYIKREVLNRIKFFNEEEFGKGYCEENEFSARVIKAGYKNILADDTYIFHYGSTSFKDEKEQRIKENKKKLYKIHWWYYFELKRFFIFDKEVKSICENIRKNL